MAQPAIGQALGRVEVSQVARMGFRESSREPLQDELAPARSRPVPGDQKALQPTRHEAEQQGRLVADHLDRMRHTAGKSRVGARPHLDAASPTRAISCPCTA